MAAATAIGSVAVPALAQESNKPQLAPVEAQEVGTTVEAADILTAEDAFQISANALEPHIHRRHKKHKPVKYWYGTPGELKALKQIGTAGNAKLAFTLAKKREWFSHLQMACQDEMWYGESRFEKHAGDPKAAYGIPQSDPGSKMAAVGKDWQNNATTQIEWGYDYEKKIYHTPCQAEDFHQSHGFY